MLSAQPRCDLFGAPLQEQLGRARVAQPGIHREPAAARSFEAFPSMAVREVAVVAAAVVPGGVAPQLSADRRGCPSESSSDLAQGQSLPAKRLISRAGMCATRRCVLSRAARRSE
jgi:hypothetical protein